MVEQIFSIAPKLRSLVNHVLTFEDLHLVDDENAAYRDLGLLAHNRWSHFEGEGFVKGEMIVIDSQPADECCDLQLLTYLQI